ncbi:MAG: addiction module protein [Syntrophobacteraceae bacterium]
MSPEELKTEALRLATEAGAKLAHALLESLEDLTEAEIESLWIEEALRRDKEFDSGEVPMRRAEQAIYSRRAEG